MAVLIWTILPHTERIRVNRGMYTRTVHDLAYNPLDGKLYAASDGGIYVSSDDGDNWTNISDGIGVNQIYHMTGTPDDFDHILIGQPG